MIGAGDIGVCGTKGDEATARIVDSVLKVDSAAAINVAVFTLGDNAYPSGPGGVKDDFQRCFAKSWGSPRIMKLIRPSPGNHDYDSGSLAPYFSYFGDRAGPTGKGYYSYDVGTWHVVSLNSELFFKPANPADVKPQEDWLRNDLASHPVACTLVYFHRPFFSSGKYGTTPEMLALWNIMYSAGVDVVLNGHEHDYERFRPQSSLGVADSVKGIEQIVAGTGGGELRRMNDSPPPNSVYRIHGRFGVLKLTLGSGEYGHAFIDTNGRVWDPGGRKCH